MWLSFFSRLIGAVVVALAAARAAEIRQLELSIRGAAGESIPARVLVLDDSGQSQLPPVAITENIGPDHWFACDGRARLDLPAGRYRLRVERGPEYRPMVADVDLQENTSRLFLPQRWIDLRARGYRSGENHLHIGAAALPAMIAAEDLDFGTSLYWHNGPKLPLPGRADPAAVNCTLFDSEVENAWGALYSVGPARPMPVAWNTARSNLPYAAAARALGALNCYQGGWSREALVDALLGKVDVINVADNLFQRDKFMPRPRNSNLLNVPGFTVYPGTAEGMLGLATESYYRLLNCGLHLAAGAGSATGVKSTPPGYNRAYVKMGGQTTGREFLENWRKGRNFVTNGPMLFLTAENGLEPGDTLALPAAGGRVRIRVQALSDQPLRRVAIVVNGRTVAEGQKSELDVTLNLAEGSWIAAIATADDRSLSDVELTRYRRLDRLGGELPTRLRFAHTSPIYVTVAGRGARVAASVDEARRMLAAFAAYAQTAAAPEYRREILDAVAAAERRL